MTVTAAGDLDWKSPDRSVAKVDRGGTIGAMKRGRTTITVRSSNGKTAGCVLKAQ